MEKCSWYTIKWEKETGMIIYTTSSLLGKNVLFIHIFIYTLKTFFKFIFISCRLITLQYCSGFLPYIDMNQPWIYMCSPSWSPLPPPSISHPFGSSQCTSPEHLSHASNLGWWSVSHLIIYMFQCYSLRSSHPCLLPQSKSLFYTSVSVFLSCM